MRLACENCAAIYVIDDAAVGARGVRARCPRCQHLQYVPPESLDPAARAREMGRPVSVNRPPVSGRETDPPTSPGGQLGRMALKTRVLAPPASPDESAADPAAPMPDGLFGELSGTGDPPLDLTGFTPIPRPDAPSVQPPAAAPVGPTSTPSQRIPPGSSPGTRRVPPGSNPGTPRPALAVPLDELQPPPLLEDAHVSLPSARCETCGGELLDAVALASGLCTACRPTRPRRERAEGDLSLLEARPRGRTGQQTAGSAAPSPRSPREEGRWRARPAMLAASAAVLVGLAAVAWLTVRGASPRVLGPLGRGPPAALPQGLAERLEVWGKRGDSVAVPVPAVVAEAAREIALDDPGAYASAERRLEGALVAAPRDTSALAAWLSAVALGRGTALPAVERQSNLALAESAAEHARRAPRLLVALGSWLLVPPQDPGRRDRARALAEEALATPGGHRATAHVLLAEAVAVSAPAQALAHLEQAERLDASLRRIARLRARAQAAAGNLRLAEGSLRERLALDPENLDTQLELARVLLEAGETARARKLLEVLQQAPHTQDGRAAILLGTVRDVVERRPDEAAALLRGVLRTGKLGRRERAAAQAHLAAALRAGGDLGGATAAARAALQSDPEEVGGAVQLLLLALDRRAGDEAAQQLPAILGRLDDPGREALLEGLVRSAQGRLGPAAEVFDRSMQADSGRLDAGLWAAAVRASAGDRRQALASSAALLQSDPVRPDRPPLSAAELNPVDVLRGAENRLVRLSQSDADSAPLLAEALVRWQAGDVAGMEPLLVRVLRVDDGNAVALTYRALGQLERGEGEAAARTGAAAVAANGALPLSHYVLGAALLRTGSLDAARRELREAQQLAPGLLAAQVRLAEAEARSGAASSAAARLRRALEVDPTYLPARRALYQLDPGR